MTRTLLKAKYVYPVSKDVIENGYILVEDGKIIEVGEQDDFTGNEADCQIIEHSEGTILPGLVNAHTHLEYSALGKIQYKSMVDFLLQSITLTANWNEIKVWESVKQGVRQCLDFGVTTIGDVSRWGVSPLVLSEYPIISNVAVEVFSYDAISSEKVFEKLLTKLNFLKNKISNKVSLSVSPHSPYNSHSRLWEMIIKHTISNNMLIQAHIAESLEEKNWFEFGNSDIDELHRLIGWPKVTPEITSMSPIEYLSALDLLSPNLLATHLCYASIRDIELIEDRGINIIICPRSNINLQNKLLDYSLLNSLKVKPIIATDGSTSAGNLNILEDIRLFNSKNIIENTELTKAVTLYPAKALKVDHLVGSIEKGKLANFAVFEGLESPYKWFQANKPSQVYLEGASLLAITGKK